jgi:translation elongation factor aEF-1 beta
MPALNANLKGHKSVFGGKMGDVLVIVRIYPEDIDAIEKVESGLKTFRGGELKDMRREPIAFGMSLIKAGIVVPDKTEGVMDKLETELKKLPGVNEVEVEGATLI